MMGHVLRGHGKGGEESQTNLIPFSTVRVELQLKFKITGSHILVQKFSSLTLKVKKNIYEIILIFSFKDYENQNFEKYRSGINLEVELTIYILLD